MMRLYIAGPDVFHPQAQQLGEGKKALCAEFGFEGVFPFDNGVEITGENSFREGVAIYQGNCHLMEGCQLMIANMTPFRGIGMDNGTAFEMGYMQARGARLFGYTLCEALYEARANTANAGRDADGMAVEGFEMVDNLMMVGALEAPVVIVPADPMSVPAHLEAFKQVLASIRQ
ncbi:nucleoside 2-deoxyribosyltransferase [Pokkaliibacter sp. CJK22405]|uniref:nucleoside 2-deoxyribosyltransferase n=1 Tax=Pokkaliibacter sp. CJK22405 TaxID=3384615 RepID=UPI0039856B58